MHEQVEYGVEARPKNLYSANGIGCVDWRRRWRLSISGPMTKHHVNCSDDVIVTGRK